MLPTYKLCRLCLFRGGCLLDIYEENNLEFMLENTIKDLLQLKVTKESDFPWLVCSNCSVKLTEFRLFKRRCLESQLVFNNRILPGNFHKVKNCNTKRKKRYPGMGKEFNDISSDDCGEGESEDSVIMPADLLEKGSVLETVVASGVTPSDVIGSLGFEETEMNTLGTYGFEGAGFEMPLKNEESVYVSETMFEVVADKLESFVEEETQQPEAISDPSPSIELPVKEEGATAGEALLDEEIIEGEVTVEEGAGEGKTWEAEVHDDETSASFEVPEKEVDDAPPCQPLDNSLGTGSGDWLEESISFTREHPVSKSHYDQRICPNLKDEKGPGRRTVWTPSMTLGKDVDTRNAKTPLRDGADPPSREREGERIGVGTTSSDNFRNLVVNGMTDVTSIMERSTDINGKSSSGLLVTARKSKICFRCDLCGLEFSTKGAIVKHIKEHHDEKFVYCGFRALDFRKREKLEKQNSARQDKNKVKKCRVKEHIESQEATVRESRHVCIQCSKSYNNKRNLQRHMMFHSGVRPFVCDHCSKTFTQKGNLQMHMIVHSGARPFNCEQCPKSFNHKSNLRKHMIVHSGPSPFVCEQCSKCFKQKFNLRKHMMLHSDAKRFVCEQCSKSFNHKSQLRKHMMVHSGTRPFVCEQCSKSFKHKSVLRRHMIVHSGARPFVCEQCPRSFIQKWALRVHMMVHSGERPFVCDLETRWEGERRGGTARKEESKKKKTGTKRREEIRRQKPIPRSKKK